MVVSSLLRDLSDCHQPWGIPRLPVPVPRVGVLASQGKGFTKPGGTPNRAWVGWDWRQKRGRRRRERRQNDIIFDSEVALGIDSPCCRGHDVG